MSYGLTFVGGAVGGFIGLLMGIYVPDFYMVTVGTGDPVLNGVRSGPGHVPGARRAGLRRNLVSGGFVPGL